MKKGHLCLLCARVYGVLEEWKSHPLQFRHSLRECDTLGKPRRPWRPLRQGRHHTGLYQTGRSHFEARNPALSARFHRDHAADALKCVQLRHQNIPGAEPKTRTAWRSLFYKPTISGGRILRTEIRPLFCAPGLGQSSLKAVKAHA